MDMAFATPRATAHAWLALQGPRAISVPLVTTTIRAVPTATRHSAAVDTEPVHQQEVVRATPDSLGKHAINVPRTTTAIRFVDTAVPTRPVTVWAAVRSRTLVRQRVCATRDMAAMIAACAPQTTTIGLNVVNVFPKRPAVGTVSAFLRPGNVRVRTTGRVLRVPSANST